MNLSLDVLWFRLFNQKSFEKGNSGDWNDVIEVVRGKKKEYRIFGDSRRGYNATVRPVSKFEYAKELLSDYLGITCQHPVWYSNFRYYSIDSLKSQINISIEVEEARYVESLIHFVRYEDFNKGITLCGSMPSADGKARSGTNWMPMVNCPECKAAWGKQNKL